MRAPFEAAAADVHVGAAFTLDEPAAYERQQGQLSSWMKGRFDLVVGFTVSSFPIVEAARRLGVPSVLRIGEAAPLSTVLGWLSVPIVPAIERRAQQAFAQASVLMSNSHAAVETYRADGFDGTFVVVGTGIDVAGAKRYVDSSDRLAVRRRLGIRADERLLFCGASLWPIKGQALLVEAIEQLHQRQPALTCVLMGGGIPDYADAIRSFVSRHGLEGAVRILPFQADLREWWIAADAAVCPSESESLPAAVLEAMAFGLPVLSCRVGDVPLFVEDGVSGWLVDHADLGALVAGLEAVATTPPERLRVMGQAAARSVARHFERTEIFDQITNLLRTTANDATSG